MEISSQQMQKLKNIELELFKIFVDTCKKLDLTYYLVGGTLLGAVRHEGFIPWDDDIDVAMPRKEYEIFLREAQKYVPEWCFVQDRLSDCEYPMNFAKLRDSRTTFLESSVKKYKINHGVYIDIFPLDYYPENFEAQKIFDKKNRILHYRLRINYFIPKQNKKGFIKELGGLVVGNVLRIKYPTLQSVLIARDSLYRNVSKSNLIANYNGAWGKKEIVPAEWYGSGTIGVFENIEVILPKEYDKWLTQVYGNYMTFPPIEKRVTHHFTEVIDLEKSYTEYQK